MSTMFALLPILLFYVLPAAFIVWAVLTIIRLQKENNTLLRDLKEKLTENK